MYQLTLFKALKESKSRESLNDTAFHLGRNLASKALLYIRANNADRQNCLNDLTFAHRAYIIITKL